MTCASATLPHATPTHAHCVQVHHQHRSSTPQDFVVALTTIDCLTRHQVKHARSARRQGAPAKYEACTYFQTGPVLTTRRKLADPQ